MDIPDVAAKAQERRPVVAVAYGPRSVAPMQLAASAAPICDLLWFVDGRIPEVREMQPLLQQLGVVVDVGGLDVESAASELARHAPDGVVTYFDTGMVDVGRIAQRLGLPFASPETCRLLTDKLAQRHALQAAGLRVPRYWPVAGGPGRSAVDAVPDVRWPAVLKPRSETGSHNTFLAHDPEHAAALLDSLGDDRAPMLLEEFLTDDPAWPEGPYANYVSVETVVAHGLASHVAITGRFPPAETFRETGFFIPAVLSAADQHAALDLGTRAVAALGVDYGCLHTEVKFTADGPRILEVNGRVGFGVAAMLDKAAAFDLLATSLRVALGEHIDIAGPVPCNHVGYRLFLQPPAIRADVESIDGVGQLADHPGVESVTVHRGPGWTVDWRDGTRSFVLAVVGVAEDHDEVVRVWRAMNDDVTVSYADTGSAADVRVT